MLSRVDHGPGRPAKAAQASKGKRPGTDPAARKYATRPTTLVGRALAAMTPTTMSPTGDESPEDTAATTSPAAAAPPPPSPHTLDDTQVAAIVAAARRLIHYQADARLVLHGWRLEYVVRKNVGNRGPKGDFLAVDPADSGNRARSMCAPNSHLSLGALDRRRSGSPSISMRESVPSAYRWSWSIAQGWSWRAGVVASGGRRLLLVASRVPMRSTSAFFVSKPRI